jgi:hypothetical protein
MTAQAGSEPTWWDNLQPIVNSHPVPPRQIQRTAPSPIDVRARLVWEKDGEEHLDTQVTAWTSDLVLVAVVDPRSKLRGVWLAPADVTRLSESEPEP